MSEPRYEFLYVPVAKIRDLWPLLAPYIERSLATTAGEYASEDVLEAALEQRMQLWAAVREDGAVVGAAVTKIAEYPRLKACYVIAMGGHAFAHWGALAIRAGERFARESGCQIIRINGRPGWERVLGQLGYRPRYRQIDKVL